MNILKVIIKNAYAHKNTEVFFEEGANWILAENEGGKTELLDMILYGITGQGLRSNISEYKGLYVELVFKIKETTFKVIRSRGADLYKLSYIKDKIEEERVATGKTAVNKYITETLGYDASVFLKLNYSKQLDGIALTSAVTSERLSLINKINGVDDANAFEKSLETERKEYRAQLKALSSKNMLEQISFQIEPELEEFSSDQYLSECKEKLSLLYESVKELEDLQMRVSFLKDIPTQEKNYLSSLNVSVIDNYIANNNSYNSILKEIKRKESKKEEYQSKIIVKNTSISLETLQENEKILQNNLKYEAQEALAKVHSLTCPSCSVEFIPEHSNFKKDTVYIDPILSKEQTKEASSYYFNTEPLLEDIQNIVDDISSLKTSLSNLNLDPTLEEFSIEELQKEVALRREILNVEKERNQVLSELFKKYPKYSSIEDVYESLKTLPSKKEELTKLSKLCQEGTDYNLKKKLFIVASEAQEKIDSDIQIITDKLKVIEQALNSSKTIRENIQSTCIPALNNIASKLINKLTGGKRYGLTLNDLYELNLDGKPINTYSGSTIVLANVAFRIALIELFYKKTFPVFLGDEIDAFADDTRAQHTHDALLKLVDEGYQLILVSHTALDFKGNKIRLEEVKNKG